MLNFSSVKKLLADIKGHGVGLESQVARTRDDVKRLHTSPPQKADVIAHFDAVIDRLAAPYDAAFKFSIDRLFGDPLNFEGINSFGILTAASPRQPASFQSVEAALLAIFRDDIKAAIRKRVEAMPWPADAGPLIAERPALIKKSELTLAALEKELADLRRQASESGVTL